MLSDFQNHFKHNNFGNNRLLKISDSDPFHEWLIPPEWEFKMEVVYTRQPTDRPPKGHTYDHEGSVRIIR